MRRTVKTNKDGSKEVERKVIAHTYGIGIHIITDCGAKKGDRIILTQYPDGSGKWEIQK
jgi:selenophosphate synthetase-related protein